MTAKVAALWNQLVEAEDDLIGVSHKDLKDRFPELDDNEIGLLYNNMNFGSGDYSIEDLEPQAMKEMIGEALHQGLDGWTPEQQIVITAFLADIALAVRMS